MKILVTGGLGFIGSHTVVELQNKNFEVVIIDDLSNSSKDVLDGIFAITGKMPIFEELDIKNEAHLNSFFQTHNDIAGVIHFAASKAVGESVEKPLLYYENNLNTLVYMLKNILKLSSSNFIFSSSCTVYGQADEMPILESAPVKKAESPYGNTKQIGEEIISDVCKVNSNFSAIALRYFNPIGAHPSAHIGELPLGVPQNLVPFITQTAAGLRDELSVFGDDYPTPDGTCIRDYIHVVDLANAIVTAVERGPANTDYECLGSNVGYSVREVINTMQEVTGKKLNIIEAPRRPGDAVASVVDTLSNLVTLNKSIEDMCLDQYKLEVGKNG